MKSKASALILGVIIFFILFKTQEDILDQDQLTWPLNKVMVYPKNLNERTYILSHLKQIPKIDVLFLGSSRIMLVNSNIFKEKNRVFSSGISVGVVPDFIAIWQHIKNLKKIPKYVVIYVDPWAMNKNNNQTNWKVNQSLYRQFFKERKSSLWGTIKEYFENKSMNQKTINLKNQRFVFENNLSKDQEGRRFDGSVIYPDHVVKPKTLKEITQKANEYLQECIFCLCDWKFDQKMFHELNVLIQDIRNSGAKVMVVLPPYQHKVYQGMMKSPLYSNILNEVVGALESKANETDALGYEFCNAINPEDSNCKETEFMDGMHSQSSCSEKIVRKCFSHFEPLLLREG
jgi:hypothetical protein